MVVRRMKRKRRKQRTRFDSVEHVISSHILNILQKPAEEGTVVEPEEEPRVFALHK